MINGYDVSAELCARRFVFARAAMVLNSHRRHPGLRALDRRRCESPAPVVSNSAAADLIRPNCFARPTTATVQTVRVCELTVLSNPRPSFSCIKIRHEFPRRERLIPARMVTASPSSSRGNFGVVHGTSISRRTPRRRASWALLFRGNYLLFWKHSRRTQGSRPLPDSHLEQERPSYELRQVYYRRGVREEIRPIFVTPPERSRASRAVPVIAANALARHARHSPS